MVIPNIGNWPQEPDMDAVADVASGGLNEWFLTWGGGAGQGVGEIEAEYASMRRAIAAGHVYLGIVHSTALTRYAFCAAAIMGERGKVMITNQTAYGSAPLAWDPVFDLELGAPTEATRHTPRLDSVVAALRQPRAEHRHREPDLHDPVTIRG